MSAENEVSGSSVRPLMPHEMRELDEKRGEEAAETVRKENGQRKLAMQTIKQAEKAPNTSTKSIGRESKDGIVDAYRELLRQPAPGDKQKRNYAELIAFRIITAAARGNLKAVKEVTDRLGGTPLRAVPQIEVPERNEDESIDFSYLSTEDLRIFARIIEKAKGDRNNDRRRIYLVDAATSFAETPNEFNLEALREAERELMTEEKARHLGKIEIESEPSDALATPSDSPVASTTVTH